MWTQIIIILTLGAFLLTGYIGKRSKTFQDFALSKGKLGWFQIATGLSMTFAGGAATISMASIGYMFGYNGLVDGIAAFTGILIASIFAYKFKKDSGITITDLYTTKNKKLAFLISTVTTIFYVLILAAQFGAIGKLLAPHFPTLDIQLLILIPSILVFSYVFFGGFSSVTKTDMLQWFLVTFIFTIPVIISLIFKTNITNTAQPAIELGTLPLDYVLLFSSVIFYYPFSQDVNLRIKSAKTLKDAKKGMIIGGLFYALISFLAVYIGRTLAISGVTLTDPETALSTFFTSIHPAWGVLSVIAILAAIVSTMDSYALNLITSIKNDIIGAFTNKKSILESKTIKFSGAIAFTIAICISIFFPQVLSLVLFALLLYISLLVPIALAKLLKLNDNYTFWASAVITTTLIVAEIKHTTVSPKVVWYLVFGFTVIIATKLLEIVLRKK